MILSPFWNNTLAGCSCTEICVSIVCLIFFPFYFVKKAINFSFFLGKTDKQIWPVCCIMPSWWVRLLLCQLPSKYKAPQELLPAGHACSLQRSGTGRVAGSSGSVACHGECLCSSAGPWGCCKHPWQPWSSWPHLRKQLTWIWAGLYLAAQHPCSWNHMNVVWQKLFACGMGNIFHFLHFLWGKQWFTQMLISMSQKHCLG